VENHDNLSHWKKARRESSVATSTSGRSNVGTVLTAKQSRTPKNPEPESTGMTRNDRLLTADSWGVGLVGTMPTNNSLGVALCKTLDESGTRVSRLCIQGVSPDTPAKSTPVEEIVETLNQGATIHTAYLVNGRWEIGNPITPLELSDGSHAVRGNPNQTIADNIRRLPDCTDPRHAP
jgi:hypothetical protein